MTSQPQVRIVEVGPRDGLQNIKNFVPTSTKLELIRKLVSAGLTTIELTSAVSPKAVPQLADCREILSSPDVQTILERHPSSHRFPVLVPNVKGLSVATGYKIREVAVFVSATEAFSKANINCTVRHGLDRAHVVIAEARKQALDVRG